MEQNNTNFGGDQNIFNQPMQVIITTPAEAKRLSVYEKLLKDVEREIDERLTQSLHKAVNVALINLGKELQPDQVSCPWSMEVRVQQCPPQALPSGTTIAEVFERSDVKHRLLILGEAGSGKTTTMLELAHHLAQKAMRRVTASVPVLVSLSSWKNRSQSIFDWLLKELQSKYNLRPELGEQGLLNHQPGLFHSK
ncbi:MAG: NACHT domain-containing protein [Thermosynechococcaceae cyanobacterium]